VYTFENWSGLPLRSLVYRTGLLVAALVVSMVGLNTDSVVAQGKDKDKVAKDKDKAKDKAKDKDKDAKVPYFEIGKGRDGKYRFTVRDADGKFLGMSGAHTFATAKEAEEGVEEFKKAVAKAKVVVKDDKDDK
jgi:uncharacterized protein YegP (UPF0339 family)